MEVDREGANPNPNPNANSSGDGSGGGSQGVGGEGGGVRGRGGEGEGEGGSSSIKIVLMSWYGRAVKLSSLIASEEEPLLLYSLLAKKDLQALLGGVGEASLQYLHLDPSFSLPE